MHYPTDKPKASAQWVWLFPGQGSQAPGMGQDLFEGVPLIRTMVDQASALTGLNLPELMFRGEPEALARTDVAQVAVFTLSTAIAAWLKQEGFLPGAVAGHSLGEFSALVVGGYLSWEEGLHLVMERGKVMAAAGAALPGTMAAITGIAPAQLEQLCAGVQETGTVVVANYNSGSQMVVSGSVEAVDRLVAEALLAGAMATRLVVGGAFHSPLMGPAQAAFEPYLTRATFHLGSIPMVSSVTGGFIRHLGGYQAELKHQISRPVQWSDAVQTLLGEGFHQYAELGSGRVLTGLVRQADRTAVCCNLRDLEALAAFVSTVN